MESPFVFWWLRHDLRLEDNRALQGALSSGLPVQPLYIIEKEHLRFFQRKEDPRAGFLFRRISELDASLRKRGGHLMVRSGEGAWETLLREFPARAVYGIKEYEPRSLREEERLRSLLKKRNIPLILVKDRVLFDPAEILKENGAPYTVYTPYRKRWIRRLLSSPPEKIPTPRSSLLLRRGDGPPPPSAEEFGFEKSSIAIPPAKVEEEIIRNYHDTREFPALEWGTTRLGIHLRYGTVSIRVVAEKALHLNETFLNELIWREFFIMILHHHPGVLRNSFHEKYDRIRWLNQPEAFRAWCEGRTGYPLVDAGMRELLSTGHMHNRVRMVTASFLSKHILTDWRRGEAFFAKHLLDHEPAANNGNWQWAAGTGCDAAPYFRIFNPELQRRRFDADREYIRRWIPELETSRYPSPIVEHKQARQRALSEYRKALQERKWP